MDDNFKKSFERATALQNLWVDSMTGIARSWSEYSPTKPPPEEMKKARQRMLGAISKSWEDFMRTPEFMEMMRESMKGSSVWGAEAKSGAARMHEAMGTAAKQDIDGVLLAIRHVEKRILDRLETLQETLDELQSDLSSLTGDHASSINDAFHKEIARRLSEIEKSLGRSASKGAAAGPRKTKPVARKAEAKPAKKAATRKTVRRK